MFVSIYDSKNNELVVDEKENVIGLIIHTEDVTHQKLAETNLGRLRSKLDIISKIGKIGSWEYDLAADKLIWCAVTKKIHEVAADYEPTIEEGIHFYLQDKSLMHLYLTHLHKLE